MVVLYLFSWANVFLSRYTNMSIYLLAQSLSYYVIRGL